MTTLFLRDSVEELPAFTVSLKGVALSRRFVEMSVACVQSFVRLPRFTLRDFFSDNGINLLMSAVNAAGSICEHSTCEPWANVLPEGYEATLLDLRKAHNNVVVVCRRKDARDTSEGVENHLRSGSHLVVLVCGYRMLLRFSRLKTCLSL